jgi:predicted  nucleic acid-binding Zn-ribbon protein
MSSCGELSRGLKVPGWMRKVLPASMRPAEPEPKPPHLRAPPNIAQIAKMAQEMQRLQQRGEDPFKALGANLPKVEDLLAFQQQLSTSPINPLAAAAQTQQAPQQLRSGTSKPAQADTPSKRATARPMPQIKGPQPAPAAARSATAPAGGEEKVDLGPELEAMFTELREMRRSRNEYRTKHDAADKQLQSAMADIKRLMAVESDLRQRLGRSEKEVSLLSTEAVALRDRLKEQRSSQKDVKAAQAEVQRVRQEAEQKVSTAVQRLGEEHAMAVDAKQLRRRIERLSKANPIARFTTDAADILDFAKAHAPAAAAASDQGVDAANDAVATAQADVASQVEAQWAALAKRHGEAAVVAVGRAFWGKSVPYGRYDAIVTVDGDGAAVLDLVSKDERFRVLATEASEGTTRVTIGAAVGAFNANPCGPVAYLRAFASLPEAQGIRLVVPAVTSAMMEDASRCRFEIQHSRSSGPGGQATNVSENCVTVTLLVDDVVIARAKSQDSRSAATNLDVAKAKLAEEPLQRHNHSISRRAANVMPVAGAPAASRPLHEGDWKQQWQPLCPSNAFDDALVRAMGALVVHSP